jgi:hypothetical protein
MVWPSAMRTTLVLELEDASAAAASGVSIRALVTLPSNWSELSLRRKSVGAWLAPGSRS